MSYRDVEPLYPDRAVTVTVTGAAGQIAYSLLPLLASGRVFGPRQRVALRLLEIEPALEALRGVCMELEDGAYPLLELPAKATADAREAFRGCDVAILVGAFPRKQGMERKELLAKNASIFKEQGEAINEVASADICCVVVGNPANTNALILSHFAPRVPKRCITAMTRLDHNRTASLVARELGCRVDQVSGVIIWGNHSSTQYPDVTHATAPGLTQAGALREALGGETRVKGEFIPTIQKRGAAVIAARKQSSAMSAANAVADHVRDWMCGTTGAASASSSSSEQQQGSAGSGDYVSMAVPSDGSYGIEQGIVYSFPVRCTPGGEYEIVRGLELDDMSRAYMNATRDELLAERDEAMSLLQ